jgi:hypothetical protein
MEALHSRRTYDYRIQEAICESGDRDLFAELKIPRSTIQRWIHRGTTDVVSCDSVDHERAELVAEIEKLRRRTALLGTIVGLLNVLLRVSNVQLDYERLPNSDAKRIFLRAIERAGRIRADGSRSDSSSTAGKAHHWGMSAPHNWAGLRFGAPTHVTEQL